MIELFTVVAFAIALEGALYALFPSGMKRMLEQVQLLPAHSLRIGGIVALAFGVAVVWGLRQFS